MTSDKGYIPKTSLIFLNFGTRIFECLVVYNLVRWLTWFFRNRRLGRCSNKFSQSSSHGSSSWWFWSRCVYPSAWIFAFVICQVIIKTALAHAASVIIATCHPLEAIIGMAGRFLVLVVNSRIVKFLDRHRELKLWVRFELLELSRVYLLLNNVIWDKK